MGHHSSASGSALLGLDGFQVVAAELVGGEWQLVVQTTAMMVGCVGCGVRATPHGRRLVARDDLHLRVERVGEGGPGERERRDRDRCRCRCERASHSGRAARLTRMRAMSSSNGTSCGM